MKRFTDTGKWAREWYQELPPRLKCFWQFLCDNADAAGVWEPNFRLASFQIGEAVFETDMGSFEHRIEKLGSGKFHIKSFVEFQYGNLSEACKAHVPVVRALQKHSLWVGYSKAIDSLQETDKEKDKERKGSPEGKTPTLQQIRGSAASSGVPQEVAEIFFHECEKRPLSQKGLWTDRDGAEMRNWQSGMKSYSMKWQANQQQRQTRNGSHAKLRGPNI